MGKGSLPAQRPGLPGRPEAPPPGNPSVARYSRAADVELMSG